MQLPESYIEKVYRMFGDDGRRWLDSVDWLIAECVRKWDLTEPRLSESLSFSLVCFAESSEYGHVVVKTVVPHPELWTEMEALSIYDGCGTCRCHAVDKSLGAMLLERVRPGLDLYSLTDWRQRVATAARVIAGLSLSADRIGPCSGLPSFNHWVASAFAAIRASGAGGPGMLRLVDEAEKVYRGLALQGCGEYLLHGDLHHGNMLLDADSGWKVIDPKGVIGPKCLECARFITNEVGDSHPEQRNMKMIEIVNTFSTALDVHPRVVAESAFVDRVLGASWSFEETRPEADMYTDMDECRFYESFLNNLG